MKKMILAVALVMGLGTSVAFAQNVMLNDTVVVDSTKQKAPVKPVEKSFALADTVVVDSTKQKEPAAPVEKKSFALADTVVVDSTKQKAPATPVEKKAPAMMYCTAFADTVVVDSTKQKEPATPVEKKSFALADTVVVDSTKQKEPATPVEKKAVAEMYCTAFADTVVVDSTKQKEPALPVEKKEPEPAKTSLFENPTDDFVAIHPEDLPEAIMASLAKTYEGDTIKEAFVASRENGKIYKIVIALTTGPEVTVFFNGEGEPVEE